MNQPLSPVDEVGRLEFLPDTGVPALQAADVIAWSMRRRLAGRQLAGVHAPLNALFDKFFTHSPAPEQIVRKMSRRFALAEQNIDPDSTTGCILIALPVVLLVLLVIGAILVLQQYLWSGGMLSLATVTFIEFRRRFLWMR